MSESRVTPDYFAMLGVSFVHGRNFTASEVEGGLPVLIVSESFVRKFWPDQNPIGRRLQITRSKQGGGDVDGVVIGVVREGVRAIRSRHEYRPLVGDLYTPLSPRTARLSEIWVQTEGNVSKINAAIPEIALTLDSDFFMRPRGSLQSLLQQWRNETKAASAIAGILGGMTLVLAAMGVYGVMAHAVAQQTHEIGVRMALGANPDSILRLMLMNGLRLVGAGLVMGAATCAAVSWFARPGLYGLSPFDPISFGGVALLLGFVALAACWIPAKQASKIEPLDALRCE
jgi:hypothetical protein